MRQILIKRKILNTGIIALNYFKLIPDLFRLGKKSIVMDCGANVGYITNLFAMTGAKVFAFEPDPIAFSRLYKRCKNKKNVICLQKAVWDKNGIIQLYSHKEGHDICLTVGSSIIAEKININNQTAQSVEVIDIIKFMKDQNKMIDLVKLDVEGAEIEILKKIISTNTQYLFRKMYVETHETKIPSQIEELKSIKKEIKNKRIRNIKLNWI